MQMKDFLIDTFRFNDTTNKLLPGKIRQLPNQERGLVLFSHLINCQYKWMARITKDPLVKEMSWWDPVYQLEKLIPEWDKSLEPWISYIEARSDEELAKEVTYPGYDGETWTSAPSDIALQLNYHSVHHRAQMQMIIRSQGLEPDFVDYIRLKSRKII